MLVRMHAAFLCLAVRTSWSLRRSSKRTQVARGEQAESSDGFYTCDSTWLERKLVRQKVFDAMEKDGYVKRNENAVVAFIGSTEGDDTRPSRDYGYIMDPPSTDTDISFFNGMYKFSSSKDVSIWIGCTPPQGAWYFGCTQYLNTLGFKLIAASMGDSLNQVNMKTSTDKFWDSTFVIITTADETAAQAASDAVKEAAPWLSGAINLLVSPAQLSPQIRMDAGLLGSVFTTGCRVSPGGLGEWGENRDRFTQYVNRREPLLYLSGEHIKEPGLPFATPAHRSRIGGQTEDALKPDFDKLLCSIRKQAFSLGFALKGEGGMSVLHPMMVDANGEQFYINGTNCILVGDGNCIQDTHDALYTTATVSLGETDLHAVVGVNHRLAGPVTYGFVQLGFETSVHDRYSEGSAIPWAPDLGEPRHYTVLLSRSTEERCQELPADMTKWCISAGTGEIIYNERAYLNVLTGTGPDPSEVLPSTVLSFEKRSPLALPPSC